MRREDDRDDHVHDEQPSGRYRREGLGGKAIALIVAAIALVVFFLQNLDESNINFLFWDWDVAIALAILIAAALGFVLGWGTARMRDRARRNR
jgi:uncharacterized integral membrane protein